MLQLETGSKTEKQTIATLNPYASLRDISEVAPFDPEKDAKLFREMYKLLKVHDAVGRFGITLLHDHFEVNDGEVLVETHNEQSRTLAIKPYRSQELKESYELQPTNWRFDENGEVVAMQFCIPTQNGHIATFE